MESDAFWESDHGEASSFEQARQLGETFAQRVGVTSEEDLRALPTAAVNTAGSRNPATDPGITAYSPSIDDYVLTDNPSNTFIDLPNSGSGILTLSPSRELSAASCLPKTIPSVHRMLHGLERSCLVDVDDENFGMLYPLDFFHLFNGANRCFQLRAKGLLLHVFFNTNESETSFPSSSLLRFARMVAA
jgi:hypothetical protein